MNIRNTKIILALFLFFFINENLIAYNKNIQSNIEIGFSPGGSAKEIVLNAIYNAKYSIDIAAYSFTSKSISIALLDAQKRGIKVRIIADKKENNKKYTSITYLANNLVSVKLNGKYNIMHNKFMIIDGVSIQTGSFNYTNNACSRNAENIIFLKNMPNVAQKYSKEFNRLWLESNSLRPSY